MSASVPYKSQDGEWLHDEFGAIRPRDMRMKPSSAPQVLHHGAPVDLPIADPATTMDGFGLPVGDGLLLCAFEAAQT